MTTSEEILEALYKGGERWQKMRHHKDIAKIKDSELSEKDLSKRDLAGLNLSNVDFFRSNLEQSNLKKANLSGADFSETNLTKAALYKCNLRGAILQEADLSGADLSDSDCTGANFQGAKLVKTNLSGANLQDAQLSRADLTESNFSNSDITSANFRAANFSGTDLTRVTYGGFKTLSGKFYGIRGIDNSFGNAVFVRDAKDQDYIDTLFEKVRGLPPGFVRTLELALLHAWGLIDHGRSLMKVGFYAAIISTIYGLVYTLDMTMDWGMMDYSNSAKTWFTPFYYSLVTYTTLGFGDVTADSLIGEMLVISEVVVGYFTLGLLLSILANTVARRS